MFAVKLVRSSAPLVQHLTKHNIHVMVPVMQKATGTVDPIQQLFVTKIREYSQKKKDLQKSGKGKFVDATADLEKQFTDEMQRIDKQYGLTKETATTLPTFDFKDPKLALFEVEGGNDLYQDARNNPYVRLDLAELDEPVEVDERYDDPLNSWESRL